MRIRLAMLADYPQAPNTLDGGLQAVTYCLVDQLKRMPDLDLHVINFRTERTHPNSLQMDRFKLHTLPLARLGTLTGFRHDQKSLNACLEAIRPSLVHSQGGGHHGILAMRSGFPAVVTIHGIHSREAPYLPDMHRRLRARIEGWIGERVCIEKARDTILISPYVADYYSSTLSGRKHLIPNPVDERFFKNERETLSNTLLFAGRLYALKGVRDLIHAASKMDGKNDLRVVLAGATKDEKYLNALKSDIASLGLNEHIELPGILSTEQLLQELSHCRCLVLPSYQETAPMVIQEAMAAGVPVIASNICGIPYQVDDGRTGFLISPGDIDGLTKKLDKLLADRDLCVNLGRLARQRASEQYRASVIASKTFDVYRMIVEESQLASLPQRPRSIEQ